MSNLASMAGNPFLPGGTTSLSIRKQRFQAGASQAPSQTLAQLLRGFLEVSGGNDSARSAADHLLRTIQQDKKSLQASWEALEVAEQSALKHSMGKRWEEMLALSHEQDPAIFYAGLYALGARGRDDDGLPFAMSVFQYLAEAAPQAPESVRLRAQREVMAIQGQGAWGRRFAFQASQFIDQALEPGALAGMGVAGAVASGLKLGFMARMAAEPASFLTRGWVAGVRASALAFPAEVAAFWGTSRAVGLALHPEKLPWDVDSISSEIASLSLGLIFLKGGQSLTAKFFDKAHGFDPLTQDLARLPALARLTRPLAHQLGMFTGIAGSHYFESKIGLRPGTENFWTDVAITWLNFNVAGQISARAMGRPHARLMQEMAVRTQAIQEGPPQDHSRLWEGFLQNFGGLTPEGFRIAIPNGERNGGVKAPQVLMSVSGENGGDGPISRPPLSFPAPIVEAPAAQLARSVERIVRVMLTEKLELGESAKMMADLYSHMDLVHEVLVRLLDEESVLHVERVEVVKQKLVEQGIPEAQWKLPEPRLTQDKVTGFERSIRIRHFEATSDRFLIWHHRFEYLRGLVRERLYEGGFEDRQAAENMLETLEQKSLEAARYYYEKESYLGDEKGPGKKSFFNEKNYPQLLEKYRFHEQRFQAFFERNPELQEALKAHKANVVPRHLLTVTWPELKTDLLRLNSYGLAPELLQPLNEVFGSGSREWFYSWGQMLRSMREELNSADFIEHFQAIHAYLVAMQGTRAFLDLRGFGKLVNAVNEIETKDKDEWIEDVAGLFVATFEEKKSLDASLERYLSQGIQEPEASETNLPGHPALRISFEQEGNFRDRESIQEKLRQGVGLAPGAEQEQAKNLAEALYGSTKVFSDKLNLHPLPRRGGLALDWKDLQEQLRRKAIFNRECTEELLSWFLKVEIPEKGGFSYNPVLYASRNDAMAGMIDFLSKDTHGPEVRGQLVRFIEQVVARDDREMMEVLAVGFQNYRLGMLRDRLVPNKLAPTEVQDRFLESLQQTAEFYLKYPEAHGPFLEIFQRVHNGPRDENARLAFPVLLKSVRLLEQGAKVQLKRTGMGSAILQVQWPNGQAENISVTSILPRERPPKNEAEGSPRDSKTNGSKPGKAKREALKSRFLPSVNSRFDLDHRLDIAVTNLGNLISYEGWFLEKPARSVVHILIPSFRSGLSRRDLEIWTRDYLERHPELAEIHLEIPKRGNEASDPMNAEQFEPVTVNRKSYTTEQLIDQLEAHIPHDPNRPDLRLEAYRLRRSLAGEDELSEANWQSIKDIYAYRDFSAINAVRVEFQRALELRYRDLRKKNLQLLPDGSVTGATKSGDLAMLGDFINVVLGTSLPVTRFSALIDLTPSPFSTKNVELEYGSGRIDFYGEIHPPESIRSALVSQALTAQTPEELVEPEGNFRFGFYRHPQHDILQAEFDNMVLPQIVRNRGVGTLLFSEFVTLTRSMGIPLIFTDRGKGMHAYWGWQFREPHEGVKMMVHFEDFLKKYLNVRKLNSSDLEAIKSIKTPQQIGYSYLEPGIRRLVVPQQSDILANRFAGLSLENKEGVGKLFLTQLEDEYNMVFDTDFQSPSMKILSNYLHQILLRHYPGFLDK